MINIKAKYDCLAYGYKKGDIFNAKEDNGYYLFTESDGLNRRRPIDDFTIIEDEPSPNNSPIRTITRKEIVPGSYGAVNVINDRALINIPTGIYTADELREAAHTLNQIAEALEDGITI